MPRLPDCDAIYEVANEWRDRCLAADGSLLWPDVSDVTWGISNLAGFIAAFTGHPDTSNKSFEEKLHLQLGTQSDAILRLTAEVIAVYCLFPADMGLGAKLNLVDAALAIRTQSPPSTQLLPSAFGHGLGKVGTWYMTGRYWQVAFFAAFAEQLKERKRDPHSFDAVRSTANEVLAKSGKNLTATRNMLLHLLFPEDTESITNESWRLQIVRALGDSPPSEDGLDEQLRLIRQKLTPTFGPGHFNLYDPEVRELWGKKTAGSQETVTNSTLTSKKELIALTSISSLAARTNLLKTQLSEIESLIRAKKQIILEGPPGSGKTYVARLFARYLAGLPLDSEQDDHVEIVQFHQSYGYEDFVAGIRPITGVAGQLTYETRPGVFIEMCRRAQAHPDETFVLIIDEINRGNLSRILGELLYGLEYRDQPVRMQYPVELENGEIVQHLTIPENLFLIGTMNSTDRSLAMIDYALRRRFYFWRLLPVENGQAPVLERWLNTRGVENQQQILNAFIDLNRTVQEKLGKDFQIGHSYFMLDDDRFDNPDVWLQVWDYAIGPLLREYFHTRRDVDETLQILERRFLMTLGLATES